jgi:hypothetical protein
MAPYRQLLDNRPAWIYISTKYECSPSSIEQISSTHRKHQKNNVPVLIYAHIGARNIDLLAAVLAEHGLPHLSISPRLGSCSRSCTETFLSYRLNQTNCVNMFLHERLHVLCFLLSAEQASVGAVRGEVVNKSTAA